MKTSLVSLPAIPLVLVLLTACGKADPQNSTVQEAWNSTNNPLRLNNQFKTVFTQLPTYGKATVLPWSDTYWPSNKGGISWRWNASDPQNFKYSLLKADAVKSMSTEKLATLSPAEKYDIYMGRYDYPTVASERKRTSPSRANWEGICHGWAAVSYQYAEPKAVTLRGASGVNVPFGSSDIKALLSYHRAIVKSERARGVSGRCNVSKDTSDYNSRPECRDANAGTFHVLLTNTVGIARQILIADVTRDLEVWNQPIYSYSTKVRGEQKPSRGAAPGTVKEVVVDTTMTYTLEISPNWQAGVRHDKSKTYTYRLELNNLGAIIGGEWLGEDRPDFFWSQPRAQFDGYYAGIYNLYKASVGEGAETGIAGSLPTFQPALPDSPDVRGYDVNTTPETLPSP